MSFAPNFQGEGHSLHGDYWSTIGGNNCSNANRKRSRNSYNNWNHINFNDYWENFGEYSGNSHIYRADHAKYIKYNAIPSSLKKRKYSASTWENSSRYYLPSTVHDNVPSSCSFPAPPTRFNADTSTSASCKHECSRFEEELVFLSRDEIDRFSPSRKDGIDALHETNLRYSYCAFLQNLGMQLEL